MIEIAVRKNAGRLVPVDQIAIDRLATIPAARDLMVKISAPQNMKLLRFLWALADKVADACDWLHDGDDAMDELKIRARHVKYIANPDTGELRIVPKSLTKLDGPGLSRLANRMVYIVCRDIVPGLDETALRTEILAMIAGDDRSPQSNSSPAAPEPQTKPAPEHVSPDVPGAGATSSPDGAPNAPLDGEPKSVSGGGDGAVANAADRPGLPQDWPAQYAAALTRATKPSMLPKRATEYWNTVGGWEKHKGGPNASTATAIYDAFANNFTDHEARDVILHELGAA